MRVMSGMRFWCNDYGFFHAGIVTDVGSGRVILASSFLWPERLVRNN